MADRTFEYMLNRLERAAKAENPAEHGYAYARNEVLRYVRGLESLRDQLRTLQIAVGHQTPTTAERQAHHARVNPDGEDREGYRPSDDDHGEAMREREANRLYEEHERRAGRAAHPEGPQHG